MLREQPTLLILGAGMDQIFAIRTAQAMGLRVLTVDMNPQSPGFTLADDYAVISNRDVPALKAFLDSYQANNHRVAGVLVMGTDIPQIGATLSEYLGVPGLSQASALLATNKYLMKCRFRERGVPVPWFSLVNSAAQLKAIAQQRGYPLVIKPLDRSGARGVFRLTPGCDLEGLFQTSLSTSWVGQVMVEDFLEGIQISTETLMYQGRGYTPGFADRNYELLEVYAPHIIENGGWVPSILSLEQRAAVENLVEQAALALGVENGIVKGDVVLTPHGPAMIEMAARLSGGDFAESLVPLGCGVNIVEAAISLAIGDKPDLDKLQPKWQKGVVNRYFFPPPGRLTGIEGINQVTQQPWVHKLEFWYRPGDLVPRLQSHADRFGVFIVTGNTRQEAEQRAAWVYDKLNILTEPV